MCRKGAYSILCDSSFGPSFGGLFGHDIFISSDSNSNQKSSSSFGWFYNHPDYEYDTDKAKSILAGSFMFQTLEIEVFSITD
jgi:hypothetical protein